MRVAVEAALEVTSSPGNMIKTSVGYFLDPQTTDISDVEGMAKKLEAKDLGLQPAPAGFYIPKIKKIKSTGLLDCVSPSDRVSLELIREVDRTCLDQDFKIRRQWRVNAVHMVRPASLVETRYREKRAELKECGGGRLQQETLGFYICRDKNLASEIARTGIRTNSYVKGCLDACMCSVARIICKTGAVGPNAIIPECNPSQGVYLFRYLDVALLSQKDVTVCVLVFKVLQGRTKQVPLSEPGTPGREPTPNFDSHVSQSAPRHGESVPVLCSKSQMYLYEYTEDAEPSKFPRQCLPFALIEFSSSGGLKTDSGTCVIGPKSISASAASAGWTSSRRLGNESVRKVGLEQYSKEYSGFTSSASQPVPPLTPPVMPSDGEVFSSSHEPVPSVVCDLDPENESSAWRSPSESRDRSETAAMELSDTRNVCQVQPLGRDLNLNDSNDQHLSSPGPVSTNRDPRLQRLSVSDNPIKTLRSEYFIPNMTGDHQIGTVVHSRLAKVDGFGNKMCGATEGSALPVHVESEPIDSQGLNCWSGPNYRRNENNNGKSSIQQNFESSSSTLSEKERLILEDSEHGVPFIPSLNRTPAKSALKKPTVTWASSPQADVKKKKTLSLQDYMKKKKAEAQTNSQTRETVKPTASSVHLDRTLLTGCVEQQVSLTKASSHPPLQEFQGCDYRPPDEISEHGDVALKMADDASSNSITKTVSESDKQKHETDTIKSAFASSPHWSNSGNSGSYPKLSNRDPRLQSSHTLCVQTQKTAEHHVNKDAYVQSRTTGDAAVQSKPPNKNAQKTSTECISELTSESQQRTNAKANITADIQEQNQAYRDKIELNSVLKLDSASHQVLFADLDDVDQENALCVFWEEPNPSDGTLDGCENGSDPISESNHTDLDISTGVIKSEENLIICPKGESEPQDILSATEEREGSNESSETGRSKDLSLSFKGEMGNGQEKVAETSQPIAFEKSNNLTLPHASGLRKECFDGAEMGLAAELKTSLHETCNKKPPASPEGHLFKQLTCLTETEETNQLLRIAKGLRGKPPISSVEDPMNVSPCSTGKKSSINTLSPCSDISRKSRNVSPCSDSSLQTSGYMDSPTESTSDLSAYLPKTKEFELVQDVEHQSNDAAKAGSGKRLKSKRKQNSNTPEADASESFVNYALLRLAKGLRPGKSIQVGGLGKNPTDDPLPVLEGVRRRRKNQVPEKTDGSNADVKSEESTQKGQTGVRGGKSTQQGQMTPKKPGKKKRMTGSMSRKKGKKKTAVKLRSSPQIDEDIDYTDFQFEEPQEFCVSIGDDMETSPNESICLTTDRVAKVESKLQSTCDSRAHSTVKRNPGEAPPSSLGQALPLSSLGLYHWTEALLQPSLDPQVALVDLFKASNGQADFDNCAICQKVIDQNMIEDNDQMQDEMMPLAGTRATTQDNGMISTKTNRNALPVSTSLEEPRLKDAEDKKLSEEMSEVITPNEGKFGEDLELSSSELSVKSSVLESESLPDNPGVIDAITADENNSHSDSTRIITLQKTSCERKLLPSIVRDKNETVCREGEDGICLDIQTDKHTSELEIPASALGNTGTCSSELLSSSALEQACSTEGKSTMSQEDCVAKDISEIDTVPAEDKACGNRHIHSRVSVPVCSQGSTKQNWQRWKINQAQKMQEKASGNTEDSQQNQNEHINLPCSSDNDTSKLVPATFIHSENMRAKSNTCEINDSELSSPASTQNRQPTSSSWQESGYWLGINELKSLHQFEENSAALKDKADIYSCCAVKISPSKLSQLMPGQAVSPSAENMLSAPSVEVAELSVAPQETCVETDESESHIKSECTDEKIGTDPSSCTQGEAVCSQESLEISVAPQPTSIKIEGSEPSVTLKEISDSVAYMPETEQCSAQQTVTSNSDSLECSFSSDQTCTDVEGNPHTHTQGRTGVDVSSQLGKAGIVGLKSLVTSKHGEEKMNSNPQACSPKEAKVHFTRQESNIETDGSGSPSASMSASMTPQNIEDNSLGCSSEETKQCVALKPVSCEIVSSEHLSDSQHTDKEIGFDSHLPEKTASGSDWNASDFFDDIISKEKGLLTHQPRSSSIPGLDLLIPLKADETISIDKCVPHLKTNGDSGKKVADVLSGDQQNSMEARESLDHPEDGTQKDAPNSMAFEKKYDEASAPDVSKSALGKRNEKKCNSESAQEKDTSSSAYRNIYSSEELDVVGTPNLGCSNLENQKKSLSAVCQSLERKFRKDSSCVSTRYAEKTYSGDLKPLGKDASEYPVDGNGFKIDSEMGAKEASVSGCPIPSLTSQRTSQKGEGKDVRSQLDVLKTSETENQESTHNKSIQSQDTPGLVFQTASYRQPPPGTELKTGATTVSSGQYGHNSSHSHFHPGMTVGPPLYQHPRPLTPLFPPPVPMPVPNTAMHMVHGPTPITVAVSAGNHDPAFISKPDEPVLGYNGHPVSFTEPMVRSLFTTRPPPLLLPPLAATSLQFPPPGVPARAPSTNIQLFCATSDQICESNTGSCLGSMALQTATPHVTSSISRPNTQSLNCSDVSRDESQSKAEIDVISWFAKREAAAKNPPKKDVVDWFSDIIDGKRNAASVLDLEPELKKARLDFMESVNNRRNRTCESLEKVSEMSSKNSKRISPCESRDNTKKESKNRKSSCGSEDTSSTKKIKMDTSKVSFKVGFTSDGMNKRQGPLRKSAGFGSDSSDSDELVVKSLTDAGKKSSDEKSRNDSNKRKISVEGFCRIVTENVKDSKEHEVFSESDDEFLPKEISFTEEKHKAYSKYEQTSGCKDSKKWRSRWDQRNNVSKNFHSQPGDTDDDMNDYAHALLEGKSCVSSLETVPNKISDSILKSVWSPTQLTRTHDRSPIQQDTSVVTKEKCDEEEPKSGKNKSNLTDKPLEFLLFAKEMIMQKLQEEENESVDTPSDPISSCEKGLPSESDASPAQQEPCISDSECLKTNTEHEQGKNSLPLKLSAETVSAITDEEVDKWKNIICQSSALPETRSERKTLVTNTSAPPKQKESISAESNPHTVNALDMSAITEEEINKLKDIVCQLSSLPVTDSFEKVAGTSVQTTTAKTNSVQSISTKRSQLAEKFTRTEQNAGPSNTEAKKTLGDRPKKSNSGGRDWSMFLTSRHNYRSRKRNYYGNIFEPPLPTDNEKSVCGHSRSPSAPTARRRNYYGDVIESSLHVDTAEPVHGHLANPSALASYPGSHPDSHLFSLLKTQQEKAKVSINDKSPDAYMLPEQERSLPSKIHTDTAEFATQGNSYSAKPCADGSSTSECLPIKTAIKNLVQSIKVHTATCLPETDCSEAQESTALVAQNKFSTEELKSSQLKISALDPHGNCVTKSEKIWQEQPESEAMTIKDLLLETFPEEDPNSFVHCLDYKLTADVTSMSKKSKKNVLLKVRKYLEHNSNTTTKSACPISVAPAHGELQLEEFAADQIELELHLIEGCLRLLEATQAIQKTPHQDLTVLSDQSFKSCLPKDSHVAVKDALTMVVKDFKDAMTDKQHACRGRPHQSVPSELLLHDELDKLYTKEGTFVILCKSIPSKPYDKLLQCRKDMEICLKKINQAACANETGVLQKEKEHIKQLHAQRVQILRTFTGSASSNRLKKVTVVRDHYAASQNHLLRVLGHKSVAKMVFFRASCEAIQNHLQILEGEMW